MSNLFPYPELRPGQGKIIEFMKDIISSGGVGLIHAPTGIGKTISALVSFLEAHPYGNVGVFLTRTKSQALVYVKELRRIAAEKGFYVTFTVLRSRKDYCPLATRGRLASLPYNVFLKICEALRGLGKCPYYSRSYSRGKPSQRMVLALEKVKESGGSPEAILSVAKKSGVCPYELAKLLASESEVIIGSYNYVFNPRVRENFLAAIDKDARDVDLIVDEAHNLPDFAADSASLAISTRLLKDCIKEVSALDGEYSDLTYLLEDMLEDVERNLRNLESREAVVDLDFLLTYADRRTVAMIKEAGEEYLRMAERAGEEPVSKMLWLSDFLEAFGELYGREEFVPFGVRSGDETVFGLKLLDPSLVVGSVIRSVHSAILMSGSLYPMQYYRIITGAEGGRELSVPSPFPEDSMAILVDAEVTTKYTERSSAMMSKIAERISVISEAIPKAVLTVFPSYEIMEAVAPRISSRRRIIMERRSLKIEDVMRALNRSREALVLSVAGGKLMEGIDYRVDGETLLGGVIIVGIPFPEVNEVLKARQSYFERRYGSYWARFLTLVAPAVRKMLQAAGRLIRDRKDRGFLVIMDYRFHRYRYWRYFPPNWRNFFVYHTPYQAVKKIREVMAKWRLI